jgi:hypothetical protein
MLIWDPNLDMPFDDLFKVQEPLVEVLAIQTRSGGQPVSNDLVVTQTSGGISTLDHLKTYFSPRKNPIKIHT